LEGVVGPNKDPGESATTVVLNFWPDRVTGVIYPDADDALTLFSKFIYIMKRLCLNLVIP